MNKFPFSVADDQKVQSLFLEGTQLRRRDEKNAKRHLTYAKKAPSQDVKKKVLLENAQTCILSQIKNDLKSAECESSEIEYISYSLPSFSSDEMTYIFEQLQRVGAKRYDFNPKLSELRIRKCMPWKAHDTLQPVVNKAFEAQKVSDDMRTYFGTNCTLFAGDWAGTIRQPDIGVYWRGKPPTYPCVVFEVGLSQNKDSLREAVEAWLCGTDGKCKVVVAVDLLETKSLDPPPEDRRFGPYYDEDQQELVGKITCDITIWRYNPATKRPYEVDQISVIPPSRQFLEISNVDLAGGEVGRLPHDKIEGGVSLDLDFYRDDLKDNIAEMAMVRGAQKKTRKRSRAQAKEDAEYKPS